MHSHAVAIPIRDPIHVQEISAMYFLDISWNISIQEISKFFLV